MIKSILILPKLLRTITFNKISLFYQCVFATVVLTNTHGKQYKVLILDYLFNENFKK